MTYILEKNTHWQEKELNSESVVIPADWTSTALNTYADIISGQSPASDLVADLGLDFHQGNSLFGDKYIKPSTKKIDRTRAPKIAPAHSILFSVRAPVGEVNIACTEMCIGRGLAALTTEHVSEWMYFRLKSMSSVFKKLSTGTTFEGITAKNLGAVTFGCPPLNEQTAIANILSDQEALIAQYDNLIALHEKRFAYLSDELLSGRVRLVQKELGDIELVKNHQWRAVKINQEHIDLPYEWVVKVFGEIATTSIGSTPPKKDDNYNGDVPWITISDLGEKFISSYSGRVKSLKNVKILPAGTLIGSFKMSVGKFGFLSESSSTNEAIIAIKPGGTNENLSFLYYYLPRIFKENATPNGQGLLLLNTKKIKSFEILVPPLDEQTLIANVLSAQEALIAQYKKLRDAEKKRFDWLSDALLSGTYRVKVEA